MNVEQWSLVIGVAMSAVMGLGPWMFMVHAKLAVIAAQIIEMNEKIAHAAEASHELWSLCARHETQLQTHEVQFAHVAERLAEMG
jgi:hypothetical protein